jgi:hypothetical protein
MDENKLKRMLLFFFGCMGARFGIAWLAYAQRWLLPYMGAVAVLIALSFIIIYVGGYRKTGPEVFGDKIWWNNLRPVHAFMYASFAVLAFSTRYSNHAWKVLLADAIIGLVAFIHHHTHI